MSFSIPLALICVVFAGSLAHSHPYPAASQQATALPISQYSLKWRNWTYHQGYAIGPKPRGGPGLEKATESDVPAVFELPDSKPAKYGMSYIIFDGTGYHSCLALSDDLVKWDLSPGVTFERSSEVGAFDYGGVVSGGYILESYNTTAPRKLAKINGTYWQLYGAYASRAGYESGPGANGIAYSSDGITWSRYSTTTPAVGPNDPQLQEWENLLIYQPFPVVHDGTIYNFYNSAKQDTREQSGVALLPVDLFPGTAGNATEWSRYPANPVLPNGADGSADAFRAADPKVLWDAEQNVWAMFYFGHDNDEKNVSIMVAFSTDLVHWEKDPTPLYESGGNPWGLDVNAAHKISLIYQAETDTYFMYYCAVDKYKNRGIAMLTSKPLH